MKIFEEGSHLIAGDAKGIIALETPEDILVLKNIVQLAETKLEDLGAKIKEDFILESYVCEDTKHVQSVLKKFKKLIGVL